MPTNPLFNSNNSPNNSTQPTKAVNRQPVFVPRTHNNFDMSYPHATTQRFGFYEPFFVMDGVPGDFIPLISEQEISSLPMVGTFKGHLTFNKDYFLVPNQAIQPNTWEYIYKHPSQGDDVPHDASNIFPLWIENNAKSIIDDMFDFLIDNLYDDQKLALQALLCLELFCSSGSLLHKLGYRISPIIRTSEYTRSFDSYFDHLISSIDTFSISVNTENISFNYDSNQIDRYTFLSLLRSFGSDASFEVEFMGFEPIESIEGLPVKADDDTNVYINMDRLCAYQLCCWQYYVNPQVDFIYNAQLWRDNLTNLLGYVTGDNTIPTFVYNGISIPYDRCSRNSYSKFVTESFGYDWDMKRYDYLSALFGFNQVLKFGDYFTDSRTRPLANGNDIVSLTSGGVSVIDLSKNIIMQRFRNAVVKLGNNFDDYLKGIFGEAPTPDYHFPKYIDHKEVAVSGFNTAITSNDSTGKLSYQVQTTDSNSDFAIDISMPSVVLGIGYFTVPFMYTQTKDRQFFHKDRFDFFNPMLQEVGDQVVYNNERTDLRPGNEIFGYQSRYNEYKQRIPIATGAFTSGNQLQSWIFTIDSLFAPFIDVAVSNVQSPEFIRHFDFEFNRFFEQFAGFSLANGFHFIIYFNNKVDSVRPLIVNPNTL